MSQDSAKLAEAISLPDVPAIVIFLREVHDSLNVLDDGSIDFVTLPIRIFFRVR